MKMDSIIEILKHYYPQNLKYESQAYQNSVEHKNYAEAIKKKDSKLLHSLEKLFPKTVEDFSSEEYPSYEYIILLDKTSTADTETKRELYLFVSKLCNCYYFYLLKTLVQNQEEKYTILEDSAEYQKGINALQAYFDKAGYVQIKKDLACRTVENMETELKEKPTVFHLLFSDLYNHYY